MEASPSDGTPKRKRCRVFVVDQVAPASRKSTCAAREWKIVEAAPGKENPLVPTKQSNGRPQESPDCFNLFHLALLCLIIASRLAFLYRHLLPLKSLK